MRALIIFFTFVAVISAAGTYFTTRYTWKEMGPGIKVTDEPIQINLPKEKQYTFNKDGFSLTVVAEFSGKGRVLHTKTYSRGEPSKLSPIDLSIGWKQMSDDSIIKHLKIHQDHRFVKWRPKEWDGKTSWRKITRNAANIHIIPINKEILNIVENLDNGEVIEFSGKLVRVKRPNWPGWSWNTSMTRGDTGNGACEILYLEGIETL